MSQIVFLSLIVILMCFGLILDYKIHHKLNKNEDVSKMKHQEHILNAITNTILFSYILIKLWLSSLPTGIFIFALITTLMFVSIKLIKYFNKETKLSLLIGLIMIILLTAMYILASIILLLIELIMIILLNETQAIF